MADLDRGLAHTRLLLERSSLLPHVAENHARLSKGHNNSFYSKKRNYDYCFVNTVPIPMDVAWKTLEQLNLECACLNGRTKSFFD